MLLILRTQLHKQQILPLNKKCGETRRVKKRAIFLRMSVEEEYEGYQTRTMLASLVFACGLYPRREREKEPYLLLSHQIDSERLVPTWQHLQGWDIEGLPDLSIRAPLSLNTGLGRVQPQGRLDDKHTGWERCLLSTVVISNQAENVTLGVPFLWIVLVHPRATC